MAFIHLVVIVLGILSAIYLILQVFAAIYFIYSSIKTHGFKFNEWDFDSQITKINGIN